MKSQYQLYLVILMWTKYQKNNDDAKQNSSFSDASQTQKYFENKMQKLVSDIIYPVHNHGYTIQEKIVNELQNGDIEIQQQNQKFTIQKMKQITEQIHEKHQKFNKQLQILKWSLRKSSTSVKTHTPRSQSYQSHRFKIINRKNSDFTQNDIIQYKKRQQSAAKRLKQLKKYKQIIQLKKYQQQNQKKSQQQQKQKQSDKSSEELNLLKKKRKLELIQQRIKQLSQKKKHRLQILQKSAIKSTPFLPKYKMLQKHFNQEEQMEKHRKKMEQKQQIRKRIHENEPDSIKAHQKQYMEHIKSRLIKSRVNRAKTEQGAQKKELEKNFRLISANPEVVEQKKQQRKRVKQFQKVVHRIKLNTNLQRQIQIQIAKDKAKNPFKYHFLKGKSKDLDDYQVYKQHPNFNFNSDQKILGNRYLRQVSKSLRKSRVQSNSSSYVHLKTQLPLHQRPYKNYLEDAKKNAKHRKKDSIEQLVHKYDKSKIIDILQTKSQQHRLNAIQKIGQWKKQLESYEKSINAEQQIDDEYLKSLKMKLKCISICE